MNARVPVVGTNLPAPHYPNQTPPPPEPALPPPGPRPDLQAIMAALPPYEAGRDRPVTMDANGVITYSRDGEFVDEPREINGYRRDPDEPYRFVPLWPVCGLRYFMGVRYPRCGCIEAIARCNNPACPIFYQRITATHCADCRQRVER